MQLLAKASFDPIKDKLWAVGDLVARGPSSLQTLDYLRSLEGAFETVLGNHDLHLIAVYYGISTPKANDLLDELINSNQFEDHIQWLRSKPLAIRIDKKHLLSHAGLYPDWSFKQAIKYSNEVSCVLQSANAKAFLEQMYGNQPSVWQESLSGHDRLRFIVNAFTRMRFLDKKALEFKQKCHPNAAPKAIKPWFCVKNKSLKSHQKVTFGHWASLQGETHNPQFIGLDTGYVWGKHMTLYCIETSDFFTTSV